MFDTYVTIVGNVLTAPEWRRTTKSNSLVANFKVASTSRRLNRDTGEWVDGNSLRVRVNCWRKLAEGVASSVMVGDPLVVVGRLYTRDWTDGEGNHRTLYELEAVAIGHDLSRGRAKFVRNRPTMATSEVEDAEAEARVRGEETEAVPGDEAPARPGEYLFDDDGDADLADVPPFPAGGFDPLAGIRGGGFDPAPAGFDPLAGIRGGGFDPAPAGFDDADALAPLAPIASGASGVAGASGGRVGVPGDGVGGLGGGSDVPDAVDGAADPLDGGDPPPAGRSRRGRASATVPA